MNQGLLFSVLVVTRNEEEYIHYLLQSILKQDFPHTSYEVIVVDGDSTDQTVEIVRGIMKEYPNRVSLFSNPAKTLPTGWNIGIKQAQGKYVLRLDGHSLIPHDFLQKNYEVIKQHPDMACVGGVIQSEGRGFWGKVNAYVSSHLFGVGNSKFRIIKEEWEGIVDTVPYGAYQRQLFEKVGFFDENLKRNEDLDMHARIRQAGGQFYLSTKIRSTYFVRPTLYGLMEKSFGDGKWGMIANKNGLGAWRIRHFIPLLTLLWGFILLLSSFLVPFMGLLLLGFVSLYLVLVGFSSVTIGKEKGINYFCGAMLSFAMLHLSRAAGSLTGLFSQAYRRNADKNEKQKRSLSDIAG